MEAPTAAQKRSLITVFSFREFFWIEVEQVGHSSFSHGTELLLGGWSVEGITWVGKRVLRLFFKLQWVIGS